MKFVLSLLLLIAAFGTSAFADTTLFRTTGTFTGTTTTPNITFTGNPLQIVDSPSFIDFGSFFVASSLSGPINVSEGFVLTVQQFLPGAGSGTVDATLNGTIKFLSDSVVLTFTSPLSFTINGEVYTIDQQTWNLGLDRYTTIDGSVTPVPEPSSLLLLGSGLFAAAGFVRRRLVA